MSPPIGAESGVDPSHGLPGAKRWFDLGFCLLTAVVWLPLALTGMLAVLLGSGWPAVYVSSRIVYRGERARVIKLRAMVRNAAEIANRRTVPTSARAISTRFAPSTTGTLSRANICAFSNK